MADLYEVLADVPEREPLGLARRSLYGANLHTAFGEVFVGYVDVRSIEDGIAGRVLPVVFSSPGLSS